MSYYAIYQHVNEKEYTLYAVVKGIEFMDELILTWTYHNGILTVDMPFDKKNIYYGEPKTEPQELIYYSRYRRPVCNDEECIYLNYKHLFIAKELSCKGLFKLIDELGILTEEDESLGKFLLFGIENIWYMTKTCDYYYWEK